MGDELDRPGCPSAFRASTKTGSEVKVELIFCIDNGLEKVGACALGTALRSPAPQHQEGCDADLHREHRRQRCSGFRSFALIVKGLHGCSLAQNTAKCFEFGSTLP